MRDRAAGWLVRAVVVAVLWGRPGETRAAKGRWYTYESCRLIENRANDGDSFLVRTKSRELKVRLYFADCPEVDRSIPERVREQAEHWGITEDTVLALAVEATEFAADFLKDGFTVRTMKENARGRGGRDRYYALIEAGGRDLAEALVARGLARVYGRGVEPPGGSTEKERWRHLRVLDGAARRERRGAWAGSLPDEAHALKRLEAWLGKERLLKSALRIYDIEPPGGAAGTWPRGARVRAIGKDPLGRIRIVRRDTGAPVERACQARDFVRAVESP